jgi:hypothetical protein
VQESRFRPGKFRERPAAAIREAENEISCCRAPHSLLYGGTYVRLASIKRSRTAPAFLFRRQDIGPFPVGRRYDIGLVNRNCAVHHIGQ